MGSGEEDGEMCLEWEPHTGGFAHLTPFPRLSGQALGSESDDRLGKLYMPYPRSHMQVGMDLLSPKPVLFLRPYAV